MNPLHCQTLAFGDPFHRGDFPISTCMFALTINDSYEQHAILLPTIPTINVRSLLQKIFVKTDLAILLWGGR